MKQFKIEVEVTMTGSICVEADDADAAKAAAHNEIDNWAGTMNYQLQDVSLSCDEDDDDVKPMTFDELWDDLQYFSVDKAMKKTIGEIADECREYIRKSGHQCLDDCYDEDEAAAAWMEENHPEVEESDWSGVLYNPLEFLCLDECSGDVGFSELNISFYGDCDKGIGVFHVSC